MNVIWFGGNSEIKAINIDCPNLKGTKFTLVINSNRKVIHLPTLGSQFVQDALAAAATSFCLGFSLDEIKTGLESFRVPEHRMRLIRLKNGCLILDDSYNNNPQAAKEALKTFTEISGRKKKIVVFGDMLELGSLEKRFHKEIGRVLAKMKLNYLIGVGPASKDLVREAEIKLGKNKAIWTSSSDGVLKYLKPYLMENTVVLIKGSRSIGLDKVVLELL